MSNKRKWWIVTITVALLAGTAPLKTPDARTPDLYPAEATAAETKASSETESDSWIIGWKNASQLDPAFADVSVVTARHPGGVTVARPKPGQDAAAWAKRWEQSSYVAYIQPNHKYTAAKASTDPMRRKQKYLQQIGAEGAWDRATQNTDVTVAVVDTGIDLDHPDLKPNLVPGYNLIDPLRAPDDDNGHGTNVAGVIGAVANNDVGITGLLWKGRIMPVKALDKDGTGDEDKLGEGIRYAVDHDAKIVVLSLGLNKQSPYMRSIVDYAENRGVLLVAASGNEGNAVKFPAAYPTVLAVGGVTPDGQAEALSNFGPELDVVAPWAVYTTAPNGRYEDRYGTSLAAPQVAAVCALIWAKTPTLQPYQIRGLIRQTAQDLGPPGWDARTGFGLLRADRALAQDWSADSFEPNETPAMAKAIPLNKRVDAAFSPGKDADAYRVDTPYEGTLQVELKPDDETEVELVYFDHPAAAGIVYTGRSFTLPVSKGPHTIIVQPRRPLSALVPYRMITQFAIAADPFEDNDRQYKAYKLPNRSQSVVGTFDHEADQDWYAFEVDGYGALTLRVSTDTARIDPVLAVARKGEKETVVDRNGDGETETTGPIDVYPGTYYIRVSNITSYTMPVAGQYDLEIAYDHTLIDPNEPNDKAFQATPLQSGAEAHGMMDKSGDVDWFRFKVNAESLVTVDLSDIPPGRFMYMAMQDSKLNLLTSDFNSSATKAIRLQRSLPPGSYYLKLSIDRPDSEHVYALKLNMEPLTAGYTDIENHWAKNTIVRLTGQHIVDGYSDYRFYPDRVITRGEAVTVLTRVFQWTATETPDFKDVPISHWAYDGIARASKAGVAEGYEDGTFRPDLPLTRMEMVALLAKAMHMSGKSGTGMPFSDVSADYWGAPLLRQMQEGGWIAGFEDGSFRPEQGSTRAEFLTLLSLLKSL